MKLAIRGHDLGKKGEFDLALCLKKYGFDGVQLVPYKTFSDVPYTPEISLEKAQEISNSLTKNDLSVFLLGAYFNPVHSNKDKVKLCIDVFKRYLQLANTFKAPLVGSETGSFNDDKWTYHPQNRTDGALKTVIETFSALADYAKANNTAIAMEGAAGHVCYSPDRLYEALRAINDDKIKVIFDIYNYLDNDNYGDYKQILKHGLDLFEGKIHCFHMKDCRIDNGKLTQCPIGDGMLDYDFILSTIKSYNPDAVLVLEGTVEPHIQRAVEIITKTW